MRERYFGDAMAKNDKKEIDSKLLKSINALEKATRNMQKMMAKEKTSFVYNLMGGCPLVITTSNDIDSVRTILKKFSDYLESQNETLRIVSEYNENLTIEQFIEICVSIVFFEDSPTTKKLVLRPYKEYDQLELAFDFKHVASIFGN
jgi:wobble nucleotide-excising tRNase